MVKSLSVDTSLYKPISVEDRNSFRVNLGFQPDDFIVVHSGRFSEDKNPLILAKAIHLLQHKYKNIKGLFVGNGVQKEKIESLDGCFCHAFTDQNRLVQLYGLSDLGVWPRQESTSMLDCLSCGVPIIVNDTVELTERIDGNGLYFRMDDVQHLADQIERLVLDPALRKEFAVVGREKVLAEFSWSKYASEYLKLIESPVL
ncbi:MAG: glycosyltransferase family 4 protein [Crocinitomicaceae bacterium]|nr:glycosyltransferase family 4 protein [Crocinitomicaceae bacterium]